MKDKMSSEEWSSVWKSRIKVSRLKEQVKRVVLREMGILVRDWADECGKDAPSITELGCAPGDMLVRIHSSCPEAKLRGIDYSTEGLGQARSKLVKANVHAELVHSDIFQYAPSLKSDLVVSFGLIEHFADPVKILTHHLKFAAPGGMVAVTVPNFNHPFVERCLRKYRPHDLETHDLRIMSEVALRQAFEEAGCLSIMTGCAVGPLLPSPNYMRSAMLYGLVSAAWNACSFLMPTTLLWPGLYWAFGKVPK
jgi:ubiquinone/menaquinone biosynthesis C-methylase UbiE